MKFKYRLITVIISIFALFGNFALMPLYSIASNSLANEKIETWADNHPRAASELVDWMNEHKEGAQAITKWDNKHPEQSKSFVTWVTTHVGRM